MLDVVALVLELADNQLQLVDQPGVEQPVLGPHSELILAHEVTDLEVLPHGGLPVLEGHAHDPARQTTADERAPPRFVDPMASTGRPDLTPSSQPQKGTNVVAPQVVDGRCAASSTSTAILYSSRALRNLEMQTGRDGRALVWLVARARQAAGGFVISVGSPSVRKAAWSLQLAPRKGDQGLPAQRLTDRPPGSMSRRGTVAAGAEPVVTDREDHGAEEARARQAESTSPARRAAALRRSRLLHQSTILRQVAKPEGRAPPAPWSDERH